MSISSAIPLYFSFSLTRSSAGERGGRGREGARHGRPAGRADLSLSESHTAAEQNRRQETGERQTDRWDQRQKKPDRQTERRSESGRRGLTADGRSWHTAVIGRLSPRRRQQRRRPARQPGSLVGRHLGEGGIQLIGDRLKLLLLVDQIVWKADQALVGEAPRPKHGPRTSYYSRQHCPAVRQR